MVRLCRTIHEIPLPSRKLTYPPQNGILKMIFLFPRWDMLIPWGVSTNHFATPGARTALRLLSILLQAVKFPGDVEPCGELWEMHGNSTFPTKPFKPRHSPVPHSFPQPICHHLSRNLHEAPHARRADARCNFRSAFSVWTTRKGTKCVCYTPGN